MIYNYLRTIDNGNVIIQKLVITTGHFIFSLLANSLVSLAPMTPFFSCVAYSLQVSSRDVVCPSGSSGSFKRWGHGTLAQMTECLI